MAGFKRCAALGGTQAPKGSIGPKEFDHERDDDIRRADTVAHMAPDAGAAPDRHGWLVQWRSDGSPASRCGSPVVATGQVSLRATSDAPAHPARRGRDVTPGSVLATGPAGRPEVSLGGATLLMDSNSEVQVTAIDPHQLRLLLKRGSVAMRLVTAEAVQGTSVDTAVGQFMARDLGEFRIDARGGPIAATSLHGSLFFASGKTTLGERAGERAQITSRDGELTVGFAAPKVDAFRAFVLARDAADAAPSALRRTSLQTLQASASGDADRRSE